MSPPPVSSSFFPDGGWIWIFDAPDKVLIEESDGTFREAARSSLDRELRRKSAPHGAKEAGTTKAPLTASRLIRLRDAPRYLGMDRNRFNTEVRPHLTEIPIGKQGVAFDRLDLDTWTDEYKARNGRPGKQKGENKPWDESKSPVSLTGRASGTSTRLSEEEEFAKALE